MQEAVESMAAELSTHNDHYTSASNLFPKIFDQYPSPCTSHHEPREPRIERVKEGETKLRTQQEQQVNEDQNRIH